MAFSLNVFQPGETGATQCGAAASAPVANDFQFVEEHSKDFFLSRSAGGTATEMLYATR